MGGWVKKIQKSAYVICERSHSKRQTRGEEIEKCLDEGLEPTYYFSIFSHELKNTVLPFSFTKKYHDF